MFEINLEGTVAIVTGAAGGIGEAYARGLAAAGAQVVVTDVNEDGASSVAAKLAADGYQAFGVRLDVTSEESIASAVKATVDRFGGIDVLVNNAGLMAEIPQVGLMDISMEWYERVQRVNVMGPLMVSRAVVPYMKERGAGKIIMQSSTAGFKPGSLYRLSKHAIIGLTAGLAVELGPSNINVNAIAPGLVQTEASFRSGGERDSAKRTAIYSQIPHIRPDRPATDLIGTLLLLASPAGDFINGQTILVDGGWSIRL